MKEITALPFSILDTIPSAKESFVKELLAKEQGDFNRKIVVLDDDPTGIQTVHDIYVYTDWEEDTIFKAFEAKENLFFLMTNSRSFSSLQTKEVHTLIAKRIAKVAKQTNKEYVIISRGDSTLRGHFPLETETLRQELESLTNTHFDGEILCPFFLEGGRYTMNNIHYVKEGDFLIPAGQTEFAKDKTFGYSSSDLNGYVEEKTNGKYTAQSCCDISLEELRALDTDGITKKLLKATDFQKIIVNAIDYTDIQVFCIAWIRAMKAGKNYIARSAAALPKVLGGISDKDLLTKKELVADSNPNGGIIIVGSHVKKTTAQLEELQTLSDKLVFLEFHVNTYFEENGLSREVEEVLSQTEHLISEGTSVVIYTSRTLLVPEGCDKDAILMASVEISNALTSIISKLSIKPRFIIAKGGITSSDVGTKGLQVKKALVMGQVKKGIPVWMTGNESKFPCMPYIIFPGNVGEVSTLREIADELI